MKYSASRAAEVFATYSTTKSRVAKGQGAKYANELAKKHAGDAKRIGNWVYGQRPGDNKKYPNNFPAPTTDKK